MKVGEIMTTPVVTVSPRTPVPEVAALLREHRISGVPVLDDAHAVVGLVSDYDLLARTGATAGEVMTRAVITVTEETEVDEVRHLLVDRRVRRLPVTAGGRLVGVVSRSDVVALLTTEWACAVCGQVLRGERPPARCPTCQTPAERFTAQEPPPGS